MSIPRRIEPCPQCGSRATEKVSAIVASGTHERTNNNLGISSSLNDDDPRISVNIGRNMEVNRSLLAGQLSCPEKGYKGHEMRSAGGWLTLMLIFFLILQFVKQGGIGEKITLGTATAAELGELETTHATITVLIVGLVCTVAMFLIGEYRAGMEGAAARLVWEDLYYCKKDHLVYVYDYPEKSAPADRLKDYLVSPGLRRKYLDRLGHLK